MGEVSGSAKNDYKITGCEQMVVTAANLANTAYASQCSEKLSSDTTEIITITRATAKLNIEGSTLNGGVTSTASAKSTVVIGKNVSLQMTSEMKASAESSAEAILRNIQAAEKGFLASPQGGQKVGTLQTSKNFSSTLQQVKESVLLKFTAYTETGAEAILNIRNSTVSGDVLNSADAETEVKALLVSDVILKSIFQNTTVQKATSVTETEQETKTIGLDKIVETIGEVITAFAAQFAGVAKAYAMVIPIVLAVLVVGGGGLGVLSNRSRLGRIRKGSLFTLVLLVIGLCLIVAGIYDFATDDRSPYPGFLQALEKDLKNNLSTETTTKLKVDIKASNVGGGNGMNATAPYFQSVGDQQKFVTWFGEWIQKTSTDNSKKEFAIIKKKIGNSTDMWSAFQPPATTWHWGSGVGLVVAAGLIALWIKYTTKTLILFHPEPVVDTITTETISAETDQIPSVERGDSVGWGDGARANMAGTGLSRRRQTKTQTRGPFNGGRFDSFSVSPPIYRETGRQNDSDRTNKRAIAINDKWD